MPPSALLIIVMREPKNKARDVCFAWRRGILMGDLRRCGLHPKANHGF